MRFRYYKIFINSLGYGCLPITAITDNNGDRYDYTQFLMQKKRLLKVKQFG